MEKKIANAQDKPEESANEIGCGNGCWSEAIWRAREADNETL
ncbi:MAG TPA: hypothetical protein VN642_16240 [Dongiaceae bacterium]|nr:hypothetical protein [Dongiaceae bacterium]